MGAPKPTIQAPKPTIQASKPTVQVIQEKLKQGFKCKKTKMILEGLDNKHGLDNGGDWVECDKQVPGFVFKWLHNRPDLQAKGIETWYGWNKKVEPSNVKPRMETIGSCPSGRIRTVGLSRDGP